MKTRELTHSRLIEKLHYDPQTGTFTRRFPNQHRKVGRHDKCGYLTIAVDRVKHQAHRLAWLYMTGRHPAEGMQIDHLNHVRDDNRWCNLREATQDENLSSRRMTDGIFGERGVSGHRGVYWDGRKERWYVALRRKGRHYYGGSHKNLEAAKAASSRLISKIESMQNT